MSDSTRESNPITPFAIADYRDIRRRFGIKERNRRGHIYVLGKTGAGKSSLLQNMIVSDIKAGNGLAFIDPAGDLADELLNFIPKERIKDVIYFNPGDQGYPMAFNPLRNVSSDYRHLVASGLISVFKKTWPEFWGPRLEHVLRHALLALLDYPQSTLLDLPPFLVDKNIRGKMVARIKNPQVRNFWLREFAQYSAYLKSDAIAPVLNKVGGYLATPMLRNIFGKPQGAFSLRETMDQKKILIANLSKGKIGEDNCSLLGAMLITQIQLAALSRHDLPENRRLGFYLFLDETHLVANHSLCDVLSEARKYGLSLTLTHQYLGQLDDKIRDAVFGNIGTLISFRVGQEDARILAREFAPVFDKTDLVTLPNHHIYLKLLIDGVTSEAFSAVTLPPQQYKRSYKAEVIRASRETYARPRKQVELEILRKSQRRDAATPATRKKRFEQKKLPL